jgi:CheY-like chemotaxis protein
VNAVVKRAYDAVFMDCQMPEMDGYQATAEIRRQESPDRHTPIIALLANAVPGDRERCLSVGMNEYLPKPVKLADLKAVIERMLPDRLDS